MAGFKNFNLLFLFALLLFGVFSCDNVTNPTGPNSLTQSCFPKQAQLMIYDTFIQTICGCQEGTYIATPPEGITCTVGPGTSVWFWYLNTTQLHQIQSTAQPTFPTSAVSDPNGTDPVRTHVVTLSSPGNYEFQDNYNHAINGTIVVQ